MIHPRAPRDRLLTPRAAMRRLPSLVALLASCTHGGAGDSADVGSTTLADGSDSNGSGSTAHGSLGSETSSSGTSSSGATSSDDGPAGDNTPPVASDDVVYAKQEQAAVFDPTRLLANDVDADGDALSVVAVDALSMAGATLTLAPDGTVTYQPTGGVWGTDSFTYTTGDGIAEAAATVTVEVAPTLIQLASVAQGIGGFAVDGEAAADQLGFAVSGARDVNGDGLDDLVLGAPAAAMAGRSYVVFGKPDTGRVALTDVSDGSGGFTLTATVAGDQGGAAVSGAGDVNGDGLADVIVGARGVDANGAASGRSYVVFGKAGTEAIDLADIVDGAGGFAIDGEATLDGSGRAVGGAGDVNGDGFDDLVVGAYRADPNGYASGRAYVVFGKASTSTVNTSDIVLGAGGFAIDGEDHHALTGWAVGGAGDVNGDGFDDVVVSARDLTYGDSRGRSYVVFGTTDTAIVSLTDVAQGVGGFALEGEAYQDHSGNSLRGAGDVNGDGLDDLVIGAYFADVPNPDSGRSYVVFGRADTGLFQLTDITAGIGGFAIDGDAAGDRSGTAVSGAGDVNGDGLADLIIGASNASIHGVASGRVYVVYGKAETDRVVLADVSVGNGGFALDGETLEDYAGCSVSGAGDVNGDGLADLLVGARGVDPNATINAGRSYVVFGVGTDPSMDP